MHLREFRRLAVLLSTLLVVFFALTGCQEVPFSEQMKDSIESYASSQMLPTRGLGATFAELDFFGLTKASRSVYYVYGWCMVAEVDRELKVVSAESLPMKFTIRRQFFGYKVVDHETPRSGAQYAVDIKTIIPAEHQQRLFDYPKQQTDLEQRVLDKARAHYR
ncbi:MAG: hypothetical protein FD169_2533 [Bacillota bacterium]|nr:MAG: hypothetical protein FD169_2533 [Bacillota bacterium]